MVILICREISALRHARNFSLKSELIQDINDDHFQLFVLKVNLGHFRASSTHSDRPEKAKYCNTNLPRDLSAQTS
jgi:hypothetical protein